MKGIFKKVLNALLGRQKKLTVPNKVYIAEKSTLHKLPISSKKISTFNSQSVGTSSFEKTTPISRSGLNKEHDLEVIDKEKRDSEKCQRILNYWLDAELFDLPECPIYNEKDLLSVPADDFLEIWNGNAVSSYQRGKLELNKDSRMLVMFQCHRAGYIAKDSEQHPNSEIPRTYLVGQALIPNWNEELSCFTWRRSEEDQDLTVNLATMRTLYRRCPPSAASNMSLSDWIESRVDIIENIMHRELAWEDDNTPLITEVLLQRLTTINRKLAGEFWPEDNSREFMLGQCQPIDSRFQNAEKREDELKYKGRRLKDGAVTFRWRFCYYPDGLEKKQLGPFFVNDLESCIQRIVKDGSRGMSEPLKRYLLGAEKQFEIPSALNNAAFFKPLTTKVIRGRWPENPEYGLSLLQTVAVNAGVNYSKHPLLAVNGPPGTGKTTLLKDIIAHRFVQRTYDLMSFMDDKNWLDNIDAVRVIMTNSMVVASSNNKAVENISKELPAAAQIHATYLQSMTHFSAVAGAGSWGVFCAVLGNSTNRSAFKEQFKKLKMYLKGAHDYFHLNALWRELQKSDRNHSGEIVEGFLKRWLEENKLNSLAMDITRSHAYKNKHGNFLVAFVDALQRIASSELNISQFTEIWNGFDDGQWNEARDALKAFKSQWFASGEHEKYQAQKLQDAKKRFATLYHLIETLQPSSSDWGMQALHYLLQEEHYSIQPDESGDDAERRLQLSMPLGGVKLNHARSELFVAALALNEALLEVSAKQFIACFDDVERLIDGRLETKEKIPEHAKLWAVLFAFFPIISTSLSSVENQFRLMQKPGGFGLAMFDEAGQAVNYHVVGLLQRSKQAIFVGDPIQLEPVVQTPQQIDLAIAEDFMPISTSDTEHYWGDDYLVTVSSAQSVADRAGSFVARIGERKVGLPLLVHRRCVEPMFSIANLIAYDGKMVNASHAFDWKAIPSGWLHVSENSNEINRRGYSNEKEANAAIQLIQYLAEYQPEMVRKGVYVITPFTLMSYELQRVWRRWAKDISNHTWMKQVVGLKGQNMDIEGFATHNIGTVHTFQGKEASTVILCLAASTVRNKSGGISWVNSRPNLLNVAVTRAKHHLFVIGNIDDWREGKLSSELQFSGMQCYDNFDVLKAATAKLYSEMLFESETRAMSHNKSVFKF
ncbi:AAA family ATPase [Paraneptunicella aestuarii]|uniref:DEAD/DEAH box helicase n=1 Tax=Paraneptunicella aestuarii TaxID=2831148 RepID=UPI001E444D1D|nr:DEAD/DEAH box helicase [Paraneptunicella aestuarii]UAA39235.1 AAA family ATPase [Paraneptunicella aestuarii]